MGRSPKKGVESDKDVYMRKNSFIYFIMLILCMVHVNSFPAQELQIQKINLNQRATMIEEQALKLQKDVEGFEQTIHKISEEESNNKVKEFKEEMADLETNLSAIQLRVGLTFDAMEKKYKDNYKRVAQADITQAYQYLGLDPNRACTYTEPFLKEHFKKSDDYMEENYGTPEFWKIRQSQIVLSDDLSKEEYDAFLKLSRLDPEQKKDISTYIEVPDEVLLEKIQKARASLEQSRERLENIVNSLIRQKALDQRIKEEYEEIQPITAESFRELKKNTETIIRESDQFLVDTVVPAQVFERDHLRQMRQHLTSLKQNLDSLESYRAGLIRKTLLKAMNTLWFEIVCQMQKLEKFERLYASKLHKIGKSRSAQTKDAMMHAFESAASQGQCFISKAGELISTTKQKMKQKAREWLP